MELIKNIKESTIIASGKVKDVLVEGKEKIKIKGTK